LLLLPQESTLDAQLLSSSSRRGAGSALLYDYEYSLDSTRGLKRILNTVTITGGCAAAGRVLSQQAAGAQPASVRL
jgi:hypothetical protein